MIQVYYTKKTNTAYVWASELHQSLGVELPLHKWFPRYIEYGYELNLDYSEHSRSIEMPRGGFKPAKDWAIRMDMAKHIALLQKTESGKALRDYMVRLEDEVREGALLSRSQVAALMDLCEVLGFFSVQKHLEREHFDALGFDSKPTGWWSYRAKLFGYTKEDLQEMMRGLGKRYRTMRQAIFHTNRNELVRMATVDLFLAMGKTETYALNIGDFMRDIVSRMDPEIYDDTKLSIDFKTDAQNETIAKLQNKTDRSLLLGGLA